MGRIHEDMQSLIHSQDTFAHEVRASIHDLVTNASSNKPMDIKVIGSIITIALFVVSSFVSVIAYGYSKDITRGESGQMELRFELRDIRKDLTSHMLRGGHVGLENRMAHQEGITERTQDWMLEHDRHDSNMASDIRALQQGHTHVE
jgi:hypothetical protein